MAAPDNPEPNPANQGKDQGRKPGKFETIVREKRDPPADARGTTDRGTGSNQYVVVPATKSSPPLGPAKASRATEQRSINPAVSLAPAPKAFEGIELFYIVGDEYFRGTSAPLKAYKSNDYWVVPQVRKESGEVLAYIAYNPELRRNEFAIGPNELGFFFEHEALYKWLASSTYPIVGEPRPYEVQHGRFIFSAFRGNPEGMARHFGAEASEAVNDPVWYVRSLGSIVGMKTAPVTSESGTIIPQRGVTTSTQPPVEGTTTGTLRPLAGATSSSAASTEAAAAARARAVTQPQAPGNPPVVPAPVVSAPTPP